MRVVVFFDLPNVTDAEKREYRHFRKFLLKNGFIMLQQSVYSKLALNSSVVNAIYANLKKNKPKYGLVQLLSLTENQYQQMEFLVGENTSNIVDSTERLILL